MDTGHSDLVPCPQPCSSLRRILPFLAVALLSCSPSVVAPVAQSAVVPAASSSLIPALPLGAELSRHPGLRATFSGPREFTIDQTTLGLNEGIVTVVLTNVGPTARRLGKVRLAFAIHRNDVELPCVARKPDYANDAGTLAPGESFTATSNLGCWTPIAGTYTARAFVTFDADGGAAQGDLAGQATFALVAPSGNAAHEAPSHPGLFALAGGGALTLPVPEGEQEDRDYKIAIVFTNATPRELDVPPVRASLIVYRIGEETPCMGEAIVRSLPSLASGAINVLRLPVTCVRDKPGDYVIVARVAFEHEDEKVAFDAGRVRVRVTTDLGTILPLP